MSYGKTTANGKEKGANRNHKPFASHGFNNFVETNFQAGNNDKQKYAQIRHHLNFFRAVYKVEKRGTKYNAGKHFANHCRLFEMLEHFAQKPRHNEQYQ
jgi:hypothetical protein